MKNQLIAFACILMILSGCSPRQDTAKSKAKNPKTSVGIENNIRITDSLLAKGSKSKFIQIFIEADSDGTLVKVSEPANWTDSIYVGVINQVTLPDNLGFTYIYSPYSESGDFSNTYTYYFDQNGRIKCYKRESQFFNSICSEDMIKEKNWRYFGEDGSLVKRTDSILNADGFIIRDSTSCILNYRFPVPMYFKKSEIPNLID